ncbi:MAG: aminotransferase class V-fold PLP-dependent enzyme [Dermabacter sp.]|nr:aminotransferase class V-fold PLP-dependent enzyme [Dermabacter sp.]
MTEQPRADAPTPESSTAYATSRPARVISRVWGDEQAAVEAAQKWAREHIVLAADTKATPRPAAELEAEVGPVITPGGLGHDEALRIYTDVLIPATRAAEDPMNLAYIPSAPTRAAVAFDNVVSAANVFGGVWEAGAGAIFAENQVLRWIMDLLDWPEDAAGCFVSGGTMGNLSALATARQRARERWSDTGTFTDGRPTTGFKVACAASAHSSIASAASLLDVDVVTVPLDEHGHLSGPLLEQALVENPGVFAVVASGGTTNAGIVDDIASIVEVAHARGVWVHVDGAYGGAALAAPSARPRFAGIEDADSFIVDPHKWLFAPYDSCALVYRDPSAAYRAHAQHAEYLDAIERADANPSDLAAHLSRRTRGLPLWYSLLTHGTDKYTEAVEACLATSREVQAGIEAMEHLEMVLDPELSVLVFRRLGWSDTEYHAWSQRLAKAGEILCVPTKHAGETVLRLVFVNPDTEAERVLAVLRETMV